MTVTAAGQPSKTVNDVYLTLGETTRLNVSLAAEVSELVVTAIVGPDANNTGSRTTLDAIDVQSVVSVTRDIRDLARRSALVTQNTRGDGGISIAEFQSADQPHHHRRRPGAGRLRPEHGRHADPPQPRLARRGRAVHHRRGSGRRRERRLLEGRRLDLVLKSGGNSFHGAAFVSYLNDGMVGRSIRGVDVLARQPVELRRLPVGPDLEGPRVLRGVLRAL